MHTHLGGAQDRPGQAPEAQERPGLHGLQDLDLALAKFGRRRIESAFRREVEHLAAHHPAQPGRARERRDQVKPDLGVGMRLRATENVEGKGEKAVTGQDGGRLIECLVRGRTASAQVVIVHGGQVVVRQRVAMNAFQRRPGHQGILPWDIKQGGGFHHQEWSQALAAAEADIAHGIEQSRRPGPFALDR